MREHPILFSAPMVRSLLAGTKTQTRRVVRKLPLRLNRETNAIEVDTANIENGRFAKLIPCPYGQPGDRLWVRETFCKIIGQSGGWIETDYRATYNHGYRLGDTLGLKKRWTPSIHMPRDASRITLEVTGVRVERLHDISPNDCIAEGAWPIAHRELGRGHEAVAAYQALWESINGPGSWDANPWVWVVEFRRASI